MTHLPICSVRKTFLLIAFTVLALGLWAGLVMSAPAYAQNPEDASQAIELDSPTTGATSTVEYESMTPAQEPSPPDNTGYLHVHVYDQLTGRPLGSRQISIYNQDRDLITQVTTTCRGYIEFDDLAPGWYRVILEPDPDWVTGRRGTVGEWVWVRPYWRAGVRFYERPNVTGAGLRVEAYDSSSRRANRFRDYLPGAVFTVYDAGDNIVTNGVTGCGGFVDFNDLAAGQYRVVADTGAEGAYIYPPSGERWVTLQPGALTSIWFFTVPSPGPESTPTPTSQ